MRKREDKIARAAHIKRHTEGTSNEISFSVLDAAKNGLDGDDRGSARPHFPLLGAIPLFTLGDVKKPVATPKKERGLPLSTGEFVSAESSSARSSTPQTVPGIATDAPDAAELPAAPSASTGVLPRSQSQSAGKTASSGLKRSSEAPAWQTPAEEVAQRKMRRKRRRRVAFGAACLALVALLGAGLLTVYSSYQIQQDKRKLLGATIERIAEDDEAVSSFDKQVTKVLGASLSTLDADDFEESCQKVTHSLDQVEESLLQVKAALEEMQSDLVDVNDQEAANKAIETINARVSMIHSGSDALSETTLALRSYAAAQSGWNALLEADSLARDAAALVEDTNEENVRASMDKSNQSIEAFSRAKEELVEAQGAYGVDLEVFLEYLDLRIEAQRSALASDQAYLDRDKEMTASANGRYNELDAQAVELIKGREDDPLTLIEKELSEKVESPAASYVTERSRASDADAFLRDYLGGIPK